MAFLKRQRVLTSAKRITHSTAFKVIASDHLRSLPWKSIFSDVSELPNLLTLFYQDSHEYATRHLISIR